MTGSRSSAQRKRAYLKIGRKRAGKIATKFGLDRLADRKETIMRKYGAKAREARRTEESGPFFYRGVLIEPDRALSEKRRQEIRAAMRAVFDRGIA